MRFPIGKRVKTSFPLRRSLQCRSLFICWCENAICLWSDLHFCSIHACIMSLAAVYLATDDWQPHRFVYLWKHSGGHGGNKIYSHFTFILYSIVQIRTGVVTPGTGCDTVRQSTRSDVMSPDVHACNFTSITNDGLYLPRSMIKFSHANSSQIVWLRSKHLGNVKRGDVGVCVCGLGCVCMRCVNRCLWCHGEGAQKLVFAQETVHLHRQRVAKEMYLTVCISICHQTPGGILSRWVMT